MLIGSGKNKGFYSKNYSFLTTAESQRYIFFFSYSKKQGLQLLFHVTYCWLYSYIFSMALPLSQKCWTKVKAWGGESNDFCQGQGRGSLGMRGAMVRQENLYLRWIMLLQPGFKQTCSVDQTAFHFSPPYLYKITN